MLTLRLIIPSSYLGEGIKEELAFHGINIYIDGTHYSSITFYEGSEGAPVRPTSVKVMKPAEIRLSILQPLVTGISEGSPILVANLIDRFGGTLFADVTSFEIFEWMQEGEVWATVPIKIISHKLDQVVKGLMHYKMEKPTSVQEVTRTVSITSSTIEVMEVGSEEYFITAIEFGLSVLDYNNLYSIKIYVDGEEFYKIFLMEALHLLKDHRYIVKIPHLPPLTLRKGKHLILLKLLKQDFF
ncbi:MAG: hypothetical protein QXU28_04060 [Nitrososphaerota archaeon]